VRLRIATELYIGRALLFLGDFPAAIETLKGVVDALAGEWTHDHLGLPILPAVFVRSQLIECLVEVGRFDEAARYSTEAIALAEPTNHPDTLLWAYHGLGVHHLARGQVVAATEAFEHAYELCRTFDMPVYVPRVSAELALALALAGRISEALPMVDRAVKLAAARKQAASHTQALLLCGQVCLLAGRMADAEAAGKSALEHFQHHHQRAYEAWALLLLGDVLAQQSPPDIEGARTRYRAARDLAATLGMTPLRVRCDRACDQLAARGAS